MSLEKLPGSRVTVISRVSLVRAFCKSVELVTQKSAAFDGLTTRKNNIENKTEKKIKL